jgi:hypothetical protein
MGQSGANRTSRSRRLAVVLAILGLVQTFVPMLLRHARPSLSLSIRFQVPAHKPEIALITSSTSPVSGQPWENEPTEESTDSQNVGELESLTWPEGTAPRQWSQDPRVLAGAALSLPIPSLTSRAESGRRHSWNLDLDRAAPVKLSTQLCRFLC